MKVHNPTDTGLDDHLYIIYNTSGSGVKDHTYGKYPTCTYAPNVGVPRMCVTTKNNGIYLICHSHIESKGIREMWIFTINSTVAGYPKSRGVCVLAKGVQYVKKSVFFILAYI